MPIPRRPLLLVLLLATLGMVTVFASLAIPAVRGSDTCVPSGYLGGLNTPACAPGTVTVGTQPVPSPPVSAAQDCGLVQMRGPQVVNGSAAQQAEDCLWQAYQQCTRIGTATLRVTEMGVDTVRTRDFTLRPASGGCAIQESNMFRVVPRPPMTVTYDCTGLTREADGALHFLACGNDGDIIVPRA